MEDFKLTKREWFIFTRMFPDVALCLAVNIVLTKINGAIKTYGLRRLKGKTISDRPIKLQDSD